MHVGVHDDDVPEVILPPKEPPPAGQELTVPPGPPSPTSEQEEAVKQPVPGAPQEQQPAKQHQPVSLEVQEQLAAAALQERLLLLQQGQLAPPPASAQPLQHQLAEQQPVAVIAVKDEDVAPTEVAPVQLAAPPVDPEQPATTPGQGALNAQDQAAASAGQQQEPPAAAPAAASSSAAPAAPSGGEKKGEADAATGKDGGEVSGDEEEDGLLLTKPVAFERYIYKLLKQSEPGVKISKKAMEVMNAQLNETFHRIANEAALIARNADHNEVSDRDVRTALNRVLPTDLALDAEALGNAALNRMGEDAKVGA